MYKVVHVRCVRYKGGKGQMNASVRSAMININQFHYTGVSWSYPIIAYYARSQCPGRRRGPEYSRPTTIVLDSGKPWINHGIEKLRGWKHAPQEHVDVAHHEGLILFSCPAGAEFRCLMPGTVVLSIDSITTEAGRS